MKVNLRVYLKEKLVYNNITENDYERIEYLQETHNIDHDSFRLLTGKWAGVIVTYGEIALQKPMSGDEAKLKFNYMVNEHNGFDHDELSKDPDFNNYLGDMLSHIIETALDDNEFLIGDKDAAANDNTEESNQ